MRRKLKQALKGSALLNGLLSFQLPSQRRLPGRRAVTKYASEVRLEGFGSILCCGEAFSLASQTLFS